MSLALLAAIAALIGLMAYAVFGGADFGGGVWDLLASGPRRSAQRSAIAHAMGPVWEANHVWLIFVIVVLFTAFPRAYAVVSVGLFLPLHAVLVGIVLRGTAFVFRTYGPARHGRAGARWGTVFGAASVVTPLMLGYCLGLVSSGLIRVDASVRVTVVASLWSQPLAWIMAAFALTLCAYLAAVFLTLETTGDLREDFRRRALAAGTVLVALSVVTFPALGRVAKPLQAGLLSSRALPILVGGTLAALIAGLALARRWFRIARVAASVQVAMLVAGWGAAQQPYLVYPDVTLDNAAAPASTLRFLLVALPAGMLLIAPSLWLLFRVFKRQAL